MEDNIVGYPDMDNQDKKLYTEEEVENLIRVAWTNGMASSMKILAGSEPIDFDVWFNENKKK